MGGCFTVQIAGEFIWFDVYMRRSIIKMNLLRVKDCMQIEEHWQPTKTLSKVMVCFGVKDSISLTLRQYKNLETLKYFKTLNCKELKENH